MFMSWQIINYSVGMYKFLSILSSLVITKSKLLDGALYIAIIQTLLKFKQSFRVQASKSLSLQHFFKSMLTKFRLLCT
jgi:hypothetical protein